MVSEVTYLKNYLIIKKEDYEFIIFVKNANYIAEINLIIHQYIFLLTVLVHKVKDQDQCAGLRRRCSRYEDTYPHRKQQGGLCNDALIDINIYRTLLHTT